MTSIETFLWGLFGGFSAEVSVWFALRHQAPNEFPYWTKSWTYYAPALFMIVIGGGVWPSHTPGQEQRSVQFWPFRSALRHR